MQEQITEDQIAEYKEAFSLLDKDGNGMIDTTLIPLLIRGLGNLPTNKQLEDMIHQIDPEDQKKIDFAQCISLMVKPTNQKDRQEQLLQAFQHFDRGREKRGQIVFSELKHHLTNFGQKLDEFQIEQLQKMVYQHNIIQNDSDLKYIELARILATSYKN